MPRTKKSTEERLCEYAKDYKWLEFKDNPDFNYLDARAVRSTLTQETGRNGGKLQILFRKAL